MLPDSRFELNIEFESDNNLICRAGNDVCRVIISKLQLYIPSVTFDGRNKTTTAKATAKAPRCYLKANENVYPNIHYKPSRVYRDVMSLIYSNNDFRGGTLLNRNNFENLFPFIYFKLPNKKKIK